MWHRTALWGCAFLVPFAVNHSALWSHTLGLLRLCLIHWSMMLLYIPPLIGNFAPNMWSSKQHYQDIDQLWSLISATTEKALLEAASSHVSSRGISRRHVRGHCAWQQTKSCAPSASRGRHGDPAIACGAATLSSRRLLKNARQIQEVVRLRKLGRELAANDLWQCFTQLHSLHGSSIPDVLELESIHEISWQAYHEAQQAGRLLWPNCVPPPTEVSSSCKRKDPDNSPF